MPDWLIERGIGETRYALIEGDQVIEARVVLDGVVPAGTFLDAKLKSTGRNAIAVAAGVEYLLPKGSQRATEGATVRIQVTREALGEPEPWKRPLARMLDHEPDLNQLPQGQTVDCFPGGVWEDLQEEARSGLVTFAGGELRISVTSAMTLIDIDGYLSTKGLTLAGATAAAQAIRRHAISGSIGVDFPSGTDKATRYEAAAVIDSNLPGLFERTAINGFGFMQIVRPRQHASSFEMALDRASFEARALLRRVASDTPGAKQIVANPALIAVLKRQKDWVEALSRQIGGAVTLRADASIPIHGGYAENS